MKCTIFHAHQVTLFKNRYLSDDSLYFFAGYTLGRKLISLEVSDNGTITDKGILVLRKIETLQRLRLENLPGVSDPKTVLETIKRELPKCLVITDWTPGDYTMKE